jgi:hypothetical protein
MDFSSVTTALAVHCTAVGILLFLGAILLCNKGCFNLLASGFWVWVACALFFFISPLVSLIARDLDFYMARLVGTEGSGRIYWILLTIVLGMSAFHLIYYIIPATTWLPLDANPNIVTIPCLLAFFAVALYVTIQYRSDIIGTADVQIVNGKFVGSVSGWQYAAHRFALFPMTFLLYFPRTRWVGVLTVVAFTIVRLFDYGDRFTMVTPFLAAIFLYLDRKRRKTPPVWMAALVLALGLFLVHRGHTMVNDANTDYSLEAIAKSAGNVLTGADTDMLPQMYRESAVYDQYGYTYGIPLFESAAFGWLPRNRFPWKDSLFDGLIFKPNDRPIIKILVGPKSSVVGNLYTFGSIPAVLIGMAGAGFLCRKLDGMLTPRQPAAVRALGFTYLSFLWMFFGSNTDWTLQYIVLTALPFVTVVVMERFVISKHRPAADMPHVIMRGRRCAPTERARAQG